MNWSTNEEWKKDESGIHDVIGLIQRKSGNFAKSVSHEASQQSCSIAKAARCVSISKLPTAEVAVMSLSYSAQW